MRRARDALLICVLLAASCAGLAQFKSGVLVKNGAQTSCSLLVVDSKAAVVAASCLDYASNGKPDPSTKYEVYLDDGIDGKAAKYSVESITAQPNYDRTSFANNLAVLQYNAGGSVTWGNQFAPFPDLGFQSVVYSRRTVADLDQMKWDDAQQYSFPESTSTPFYRPDGDRGSCKGVATIPTALAFNVASTDATTGLSSPGLADCPAPYGILYVTYNSTTLLMGVHSHTFVKGGSTMCRNTAQCSYYTLSYMFNAYISSVVGRKIGQGEAVLGDTGSGDPQAHLQNGTYRTIGLTTLSGNMFKDGQSEESSLESSSEESQSSSHASTRSSAESSAESSAGLHGRSGLSRGAVIGISVGASIGGLLIFAAAAFFAVRWWRTRSLRDRAHIEQVQDMLGTGAVPAAATAAGRLQGVAITTHDLPPVYDDFVADKADDCKDKK